MKVIYDVITTKESKSIVNELISDYPILTEKNEDFKISDKFQYLDFIPLPYIQYDVYQLEKSRIVLCCHSWDKEHQYAGWQWHKDGESDNITVVLYLGGNENQGGELEFRDKIIPLKLNSLNIFDSSVDHRVRPYHGSDPRIAVRWTFKVRSTNLIDL